MFQCCVGESNTNTYITIAGFPAHTHCITNYKGKSCRMGEVTASLSDELDTFHTHVDKHLFQELLLEDDSCPPQIFQADVCKYFRKVNT